MAGYPFALHRDEWIVEVIQNQSLEPIEKLCAVILIVDHTSQRSGKTLAPISLIAKKAEVLISLIFWKVICRLHRLPRFTTIQHYRAALTRPSKRQESSASPGRESPTAVKSESVRPPINHLQGISSETLEGALPAGKRR